ncbi:MAG: potassium channel family protein [Actinomycetota bacterium]
MISLISISKRFVSILRSGWKEPEFRGLAILLGGWLALGTTIYTVYEDWTVIESFYFCVMTLTTIGYGDYTPTDSTMQLYTVFYAVIGIGFFVSFSTMLVRVAWNARHPDDDDGAAAA